ncbi:hypothetical protein [Nocardiopsis sp. CNT312]|uniref:hypothetical protein n=1 Tax=Nocardiopsis sp. CNT312 TaxID=1137268 RepID=UPI0004ADBC7A|nr:hypothetical protein [Nocardiopsis sp. CNT312]
MQNFTGDHPHAQSIRPSGVVLTATGKGRVGFVDADGIAAVAVRALTDAQAPDTDLVITGPEALGYGDVAATLTRVTGHSATRAEIRDRLAVGLPREHAAMLADMDHAISQGAEDRTTDTVQRITGRPAGTFRAFAERELGRKGD